MLATTGRILAKRDVAATASPECLPHQMFFWKKLWNATWRILWRVTAACVCVRVCLTNLQRHCFVTQESSVKLVHHFCFDLSLIVMKKQKQQRPPKKEMRSVMKKSSPDRAARGKLGNMALYCTFLFLYLFFCWEGGWETSTGITCFCFTPNSTSESNQTRWPRNRTKATSHKTSQ